MIPLPDWKRNAAGDRELNRDTLRGRASQRLLLRGTTAPLPKVRLTRYTMGWSYRSVVKLENALDCLEHWSATVNRRLS